MDLEIYPYASEDVPAVERFNQRMKEGGEHYAFSKAFISTMFQRNAHCDLHQELFIAKDEEHEVRGGYYLKYQNFRINGHDQNIVDIQLPLSEGIIDAKYAYLGAQIIKDILEKQKYVFALGMGGFQYPLPRMFKKIGWSLYLVPFYFYILNARSFLRDFEYIRKIKKASLIKKMVINFFRFTGIFQLLIYILKLYSNLYGRFTTGKNISAEPFTEFSEFADSLWESNKDRYSMVAKRDHYVLNTLYPTTDERFHKLKITRNKECIGWVVLLSTQMQNDKYFGDLKVGTIVDAFCKPEDFKYVVIQSARFLKQLKTDLVICNHSNILCGKSFKKFGFLKGPSNYIFAVSRGFRDFFKDKPDFESSLIMRGDGDGPINL